MLSKDDLHIILKRMNLEIGEHSSFLQLVNKIILRGYLLILVGDV